MSNVVELVDYERMLKAISEYLKSRMLVSLAAFALLIDTPSQFYTKHARLQRCVRAGRECKLHFALSVAELPAFRGPPVDVVYRAYVSHAPSSTPVLCVQRHRPSPVRGALVCRQPPSAQTQGNANSLTHIDVPKHEGCLEEAIWRAQACGVRHEAKRGERIEGPAREAEGTVGNAVETKCEQAPRRVVAVLERPARLYVNVTPFGFDAFPPERQVVELTSKVDESFGKAELRRCCGETIAGVVFLSVEALIFVVGCWVQQQANVLRCRFT